MSRALILSSMVVAGAVLVLHGAPKEGAWLLWASIIGFVIF